VAALCVAFLCRGSAAFQMKTSSAGNQRRSVFDGSYVFDSEGAYEWSDFVQARNEHDRKVVFVFICMHDILVLLYSLADSVKSFFPN